MWIINPFAANIEDINLGLNKKKSVIDLSCNDSLMTEYDHTYKHLALGSLRIAHHSMKRQRKFCFKTNNIADIYICLRESPRIALIRLHSQRTGAFS